MRSVPRSQREVGVRQRGQRLRLGAELADPIADPIVVDRGTAVDGDARGERDESVDGQPELDNRGADTGAFMPQRGVRDRPALSWFSDHGVGGHFDGIEEHLVETEVPVNSRSGRTVMPGLDMSRMNALMPLCFGTSGSVRANRYP